LQEANALPSFLTAAVCYAIPVVIVLLNSLVTVFYVDKKEVYNPGMNI